MLDLEKIWKELKEEDILTYDDCHKIIEALRILENRMDKSRVVRKLKIEFKG